MTKYPFEKARFVKTAIKLEDYPTLKNDFGNLYPEVAVAGRSNVGKSTLLNHLFRSNKLVKTSSTPGKTQALNFFLLDDKISFVDLPGYGFAKVPVSVRKKWGPMIQSYLEARSSLKLILFLFDIRRVPNEEDLQLLDWIAHNELSAILVLTKTDKLNQSDKIKNTRKILEAFNAMNLHTVHYSVPKNRGRDQLIRMISDALTDDVEDEEKEL